MIGFSFTQNNIEYVIVLPSVTYTSGNKVVAGSQELEIYDSTVMASLETAITAYQPGGGGGGDYSQGYADGEAAKESTIASSQAVTANLYKSKLASEDATIAAADSTDIDGQGTIFSESYSYLKTSAEMQANYTDGYNAGYSAGSSTSSGTPFTKNDFVQPFMGDGQYVWSDGQNIYYSNTDIQKVLDPTTSLWIDKTWTGLTSFDSKNIWSDGQNIYYSAATAHYILNIATSTWSTKTWTGLTNFDGQYIWSGGQNIYYSYGSQQYVLDVATSAWTAKGWSGPNVNFYGNYMWSDGQNNYYSKGSAQYVLGSDNYSWTTKRWTGLTNPARQYIWSDGQNIYYSSGSTAQYVLDTTTSTWNVKTWTGLNPIRAHIWLDGQNVYYTYNTAQYALDVATSTWTSNTWYVPYALPIDVKLRVNGTAHEFSDVDMSYKPKSNNP